LYSVMRFNWRKWYSINNCERKVNARSRQCFTILFR